MWAWLTVELKLDHASVALSWLHRSSVGLIVITITVIQPVQLQLKYPHTTSQQQHGITQETDSPRLIGVPSDDLAPNTSHTSPSSALFPSFEPTNNFACRHSGQ